MSNIIKFKKSSYEVSICGHLVSVFSFKRKRYLSVYINSKGYKAVKLDNKTTLIHHLVTEHFLGKRPEGYCVNHIDGYKINNDISNLEYVTLAENTKHSYRTGLHAVAKDIKNSPKYIDGRCSDKTKYKREWYLSNKERILNKLKEKYSNNPDFYKQKSKLNYKTKENGK